MITLFIGIGTFSSGLDFPFSALLICVGLDLCNIGIGYMISKRDPKLETERRILK